MCTAHSPLVFMPCGLCYQSIYLMNQSIRLYNHSSTLPLSPSFTSCSLSLFVLFLLFSPPSSVPCYNSFLLSVLSISFHALFSFFLYFLSPFFPFFVPPTLTNSCSRNSLHHLNQKNGSTAKRTSLDWYYYKHTA